MRASIVTLTLFFCGLGSAIGAPPRRAVLSQRWFTTPHKGEVHRLKVGAHDINFYLPPHYAERARRGERFPVVYMADGPNDLNDRAPHGGWKAGRASDLVSMAGGPSPIVIGIFPAKNRNRELNEDASKTAAYLVRKLKPKVDRELATLADAKNTVVVGSSFGALFAMTAALDHPRTIGAVVAMSPSFWANPALAQRVVRSWQGHQRLYTDMGKAEAQAEHGYVEAMVTGLKARGISNDNLWYRTVAGHKHQEWSWRDRFPSALLWGLGN